MNFQDKMNDILDIISTISTQKDVNKLIDLFFRSIIKVTNSDAGSFYLCEGNRCNLIYDFNYSLDYYRKYIDEAVISNENSLLSLCISTKKIINIHDVYNNITYQCEEVKKKDERTGYHVKSLLTVPFKDSEGTTTGVLQLANAKDNVGNIIPYSEETELLLASLTSLIAVSLSNISYLQETKDIFYSIVSVTATAIDERSPYNANHTQNVALYINEFIEFLNHQYYLGLYDEYFDSNRKEQLVLAAQLHDIGKIVTPLRIMNKSTRLGQRIESIYNRFKLIKSYMKIDLLEGTVSENTFQQNIDYIDKALVEIEEINQVSLLSESHILFIEELSRLEYTYEGETIPYINEIDKDCLLIPKGTLTDSEREIMKNHVNVTSKLLDQINFSNCYKNVPIWATQHHEYLDGSGYPHQLSAKDLSTDVRILVIMDIFESLTAKDRPYKDPIPLEDAFHILDDMASEGKIDGKLVNLLKTLYFTV